MTFTICGHDPATGDFGVATSSAFVAVGLIVPAVVPGVGAAATQASALRGAADDLLARVAAGRSAQQALAQVTGADEEREVRQLAALTADEAVHFTGTETIPEVSAAHGDHCVAVANLCANDAIASAMVDAFVGANGALPDRLLHALQAGQDAGGDRRGSDSAGLTWSEDGKVQSLRSDLSTDAIGDVRRALGYLRAYERLETVSSAADVTEVLALHDDEQIRGWLIHQLRGVDDGAAEDLRHGATATTLAIADLLEERGV